MKNMLIVITFIGALALQSCMVPETGNRAQRAQARAQNAQTAKIWGGIGNAIVQGAAEGVAEGLVGNHNRNVYYYEPVAYYVPGYVPYYYGGYTYYRDPSWGHYRVTRHHRRR